MARQSARRSAQKEELAEAEVLVRELEDLEDYYFEADKDAKMKIVADRVTTLVNSVLDGETEAADDIQVVGFYLLGRAASLTPGQEAVADELLQKSLKMDPTVLRAWNALGEVHWNTHNYDKAQETFEQAIEYCGVNSVSLRNLSMVLRAIDGSGDDSENKDGSSPSRGQNFATALEKAKAAVALDAEDPMNWETLGNAYMGDFFVNSKRPDELSRALIAYERAESAYEKLGKRNPSLQLNRGMAAKYIEDYGLALRSFRKAHEIGAASAMIEGQKVLDLVQRVADQVERKGDFKTKHLRELTSDLKSDSAHRCLRDIRAASGAASTSSPEDVPLVARAVAIVERSEEVPIVVVCCDAAGEFFALSLYNALPAKVADVLIPMKSVLHIRQPKLKQISMTAPGGKQLAYPSVQVADPGDVTIVGSGTLAVAQVENVFSAGAERVEAKPTGAQASWEKGSESGGKVGAEAAKDLADEKWIAQEDARRRKEAAAKAKAQVKPKSASKKKSNQRQCPFTMKPAVKAQRSVSNEHEMVTAYSETTEYEEKDVAEVESTPDASIVCESDGEGCPAERPADAASNAQRDEVDCEAMVEGDEVDETEAETAVVDEPAREQVAATGECQDDAHPAATEQVAVERCAAAPEAGAATGPPQKPRWADLAVTDSETSECEAIARSFVRPEFIYDRRAVEV